MIFRQLYDPVSRDYTYLIGDEASRLAVLVDPMLSQIYRDLGTLKELGLRLAYVLETRVHASQTTGAPKMRVLTGCGGIAPDAVQNGFAGRSLLDGEVLRLGDISVTAIAVAGYMQSHVAYRINADRVLAGGALCEQHGSGLRHDDARRLRDALIRRLATLPDDTLLYPGHDYGGLTATTLGEERHARPLADRSEDPFSAFIARLTQPLPAELMQPATTHAAMQKDVIVARVASKPRRQLHLPKRIVRTTLPGPQRQAQIAAGTLVLIGTALSALYSPWFLLLPALIGGQLIGAGATGNSLLTQWLAKLPFNRPHAGSTARPRPNA